jgi:hypothetical protein
MLVPVNYAETPTPGVMPTILDKAGNPHDGQDGIDDFVSELLPSFSPDTSFGLAVFYSVDEISGVRQYIKAFDLNTDGSSMDPQVPLVRGAFQFVAANGFPVKIIVMEGVYEANARNVGAPPAGPRADFVDYATSGLSIIYGRRNEYIDAFVSFTSKTDDRLRKLGGFRDV